MVGTTLAMQLLELTSSSGMEVCASFAMQC